MSWLVLSISERTRVSLFGITVEELRYTLDMPDQVDGSARLRVIQYLFAKGTVLWALTLATPTEGLYRPDTWWTGVRGHGGHISVC